MKTFAISFLILIVVHPGVIRAQWQLDGNPVATGAFDQLNPAIILDGAGGAFVMWEHRTATFPDVYGQRMNASGAVQWAANGVAVCTAADGQSSPRIVSDGAGGAIVTWVDLRSGTHSDIYAQRLNASGVSQWTANGVALCNAANDQSFPSIVSDGAGGAIVTWDDDRSGTNSDIYGQRVNASGAVQWTANGVALCTAVSHQFFPTCISDQVGGAIATWTDLRNGQSDIYAQRVNAAGVVQWVVNGMALCTAPNNQSANRFISDGAGGAVVAWEDNRSNNYDIYAQRVDASGLVQWMAGGVVLCTAVANQVNPAIASDGAGGAIVSWQDHRGADYDIYTQRVNASGSVQWAADGVALCTAAGDQAFAPIVSDGAGGAIVSWEDARVSVFFADIYAQRINASGIVQWTADGVGLCTNAEDQISPRIASDGVGGAIVTWSDFRSSTNWDVYALRVNANGQVPTAVGDNTPSLSLIVGNNFPNPFSTGTTFDVTLDRESRVSVDVYDVAGHRVRAIDMGLAGAGPNQLLFDGLDDHAHALPSGIYFFSVHAGGETVTRKMVVER